MDCGVVEAFHSCAAFTVQQARRCVTMGAVVRLGGATQKQIHGSAKSLRRVLYCHAALRYS